MLFQFSNMDVRQRWRGRPKTQTMLCRGLSWQWAESNSLLYIAVCFLGQSLTLVSSHAFSTFPRVKSSAISNVYSFINLQYLMHPVDSVYPWEDVCIWFSREISSLLYSHRSLLLNPVFFHLCHVLISDSVLFCIQPISAVKKFFSFVLVLWNWSLVLA